MTVIKYTIQDRDIEWTMTWGEKYPDKPPTEQVFEEGPALAHLLVNEAVFINSNWWRKDWPELACEGIGVFVDCSDIFEWGCADGEPLPFDEIESLYRMWKKDPHWGGAVWCIMRRKIGPQRPVADRIAKAGIWDLPEMMADFIAAPAAIAV